MATPSREPADEKLTPQTPCSRDQEVRITVNPVTGVPIVSPPLFRIGKGKFEEVHWICDQNFSVNFNKDGSPFYESQFDQDHPYSGLPLRLGTGLGDLRKYNYSVTVGGRTLDPQGVVDP